MARGTGGKDRTLPTITITAPTNASRIAFGTSVTISATASDNKAVASVMFTVSDPVGTIVHQVTDSASPYSTSFTMPSVVGNYQIWVKATDTSGNFTSQYISVAAYNSAISTTTTTTVAPAPAPTLPSSKILATPTAFNQGGEGSCCAMANVLAHSVDQYYYTGATSYTASTNIFSCEFLYNLVKAASGCGSGAAMGQTLEVRRQQGICTEAILPYDTMNGCDSAIITQPMYDNAANYKSQWYSYGLATDKYLIKRLLCNNHALPFSFQMDSNFYNAGQITIDGVNQVDQATLCNYVWSSRGTMMYSHACALVGYNDSKNAYLIQNSWGTSWGCNGKLWVDQDFFATIVGYVYFTTARPDHNFYPVL